MAITVADLEVRAKANVRDAQQGLTGLQGDAEKAAGGATGAMARIGPAASRAFQVGSVAAGTFVASSVEAFGGFDTKMREVFTLMPGISEDAMGAMRDDVLQLARDTGKMPDEVLPALYQAISAGVPPDNVFDFLASANEAAVGGVTSLDTAVSSMASVVNAYGSDVLSAGEASDLMFTAVKGGITTFDELGGSLFQVVPTAAALGVGFGDVTAAMATLTSQGTPTSVATTQMRQLFVELSKEGSKAAGVFEEMAGKSFQDFIAEGGNVQEALQIMEAAADEGGVKLQDLFGSVEAGSAALGLTGAGTEKFAAELENAAAATGATTEAFETMEGGVGNAAAKMAAHFGTFAVEVGGFFEPIAPALLSLNAMAPALGGLVTPAKLAGGAIGALGGKVLPGLVKGVGGALTAAIPALGGAVTGLVSGIGGLLAGAMPLLAAAWPVLLVAALVAGIALLLSNEEIRTAVFDFIGGVVAWIGDALGAVGEFFGSVISAVAGFFGELGAMAGNAIGGFVSTIAGGVESVIGFIVAIPGRVAGWIGGLIGGAVQAGSGVLSTISGFVGNVVSTVLAIPGRVLGWIGGLIGGATRAASGFLSAIVGGVGSVVSTILGIPGRVLGIIGGFAGVARDAVGGFVDMFLGLPGKILGIVSNAISGAASAVGDFFGNIGGFVGGFIPSFQTGAWETPEGLAYLHAGEMVLPPGLAESFRSFMGAGPTGGEMPMGDVFQETNINVTLPGATRPMGPNDVARPLRRMATLGVLG